MTISRTSIAVLLASVSAVAVAADVTPSVSHLSVSVPRLDEMTPVYQPFDIRQAVPSGSKGGIRVQYLSDDLSVFPLNAATATVTLRPSGAGASINCTFSAATPILSASNGGQCFFRMTGPLNDTVQIYHMGLLTKNEDIRYTINGLQAAIPGHNILPFDSDTIAGGPKPRPTLGRNPARLAMVIDKSGSMDWSAKPAGTPGCGAFFSPTPACRRWNILTSAAAQMTNVAKAYATPGDQLGVVFFDSNASNTGGIAAMNTTTLNAATSAIGLRSPSGMTSIGKGVSNLKADLVANAAANNNMVLLFTDGEQNTAPFLTSDGTQLLLNPTQNQPFGAPWMDNAPVSLCAFRLRTDDPASPGGTTSLQQIADQGCDGLMNSPMTLDAQPADLVAFFLQVLNTTLIGDKIEFISRAALSPAPNTTASVPFRTSAEDGAVTLLLGWPGAGNPGEAERGMPADVRIEKDGIVWDAFRDRAVELVRGPDHLVMTLRAPFCNAKRDCVKPGGDWRLAFTPRGNNTNNGKRDYALTVLGDNATIASRFTVDQPLPGVGRPLRLRADLREAGVPVGGLPTGSVVAIISGPEANLGNILSASQQRGNRLDVRDAVSPAGQKALAMFSGKERDDILAATGFYGDARVPLKEMSPGIYEASINAKFEGVYRVTFLVDGQAPDNGPFQRTFSTDRYVPVAIDAAKTAAGVTVATAANCGATRCYTVGIRPVDQRGNLMGPGKGALFGIDPRRATITAVNDRLDGSYALSISLARRVTALPDLTIAGQAKLSIPLGRAILRPGTDRPTPVLR